MDTTNDERDYCFEYTNMSEMLTKTFADTDYRFGQLHFAEPMGDGNYPEHLVDPPECLPSGWTWYHEIDMVLHRDKGVLLLRACSRPWKAPKPALREAIEEEHAELTRLEWKIRDRLERVGYWKGRPVVIGAGLVLAEPCPPELIPDAVPDAVLIHPRDYDQLPRRVDEILAYYTTEQASPVNEYGDRLVADLTSSEGLLGHFTDEAHLIEFWDGFDDEFEAMFGDE